MIKHNTPGQPDGEQTSWIDGALLGHWKGINWRKTGQLKANALTLESYIMDRWTKNPVNVESFDRVVIARLRMIESKTPVIRLRVASVAGYGGRVQVEV